MAYSRSDLAAFSAFLSIARHRSFRRAATELEISASALSHALKALEERLGVRLINRTNRSLTLTAAGEELQASISDPFDQIGRAVDQLNRFRDAPSGRVRLNVVADAAEFLLAPVMPILVERYPDIDIEICSSNRMVDVTESGFDAGIRYGGTVPEDMITQRLSADMHWRIGASPAYLNKHGRPTHPNDIASHQCLKVRLGDDRLYRWEFERGDEEMALATPGSITIDDSGIAVAMAVRGVGLMYGPEPAMAEAVAQGTLEYVLEDWVTAGPGYHIYYSSRRHVPAGLKLLIDLIREVRPLGL